MRLFKLSVILLTAAGFASCADHRRAAEVTPAFYFWKTRYALSGADSSVLRGTGARKLYVRFCDVDWSGAEEKILPRAPLEFVQPTDNGLAYVPVVFITARTLAHLPDSPAVESLAQNIVHLVSRMCEDAGIQPREVQLDCDWTSSRKETYFALLRAVKRQAFLKKKTLSATIRLHQVKYVAKSGAPPADRGMLMCYNMGNTRKPGAHNSILDANVAEDYLNDIDSYPLPLDVALPLFRWCVLFRDEKLVGILRDVPPESAAKVSFLRKEEGPLYRCAADTLWHGYGFKTGDVLRTEIVEAADIRRIARYAAQRIRNRDLTVALYHLDPVTCSKYSQDELEDFFAACR